jgi:ADP-ribose pyrophosphatase YjhB (NUDIX family)
MTEITINSASRELKEETGYSGQFKSFFALPKRNPIKIFENIFYDAWKGLENAAISVFEIDKRDEDNLKPKQNLDECEVIKVHEVKLSELLEFITEKIENENYGCSSHVYSFAMGIQFRKFLEGLYKK